MARFTKHRLAQGPFDERASDTDDLELLILGSKRTAELRPQVDVAGTGLKQRLVDVGEQGPELAPPAGRERVRLEEMRDALAMPIDGIERLADGHLVAFDQGDGVAGAA
jgi:hypothetical protein